MHTKLRLVTTMMLAASMSAQISTAAPGDVYYDSVTYTPSSVGPEASEVAAYRVNRFLSVDANNQPLTNDCENIYPDSGENVGWLGSRVVLGLVDMYKATGDEQFLHKLVDQADRIFGCRLDHENQRTGGTYLDTHRNSSTFPAWPSYSYTSPRFTTNVSHAVHSAAFVYATARFVRIVRERNLTAFTSKATQYLTWLLQSIHAFDCERTGAGCNPDSTGLYIYPPSGSGGPWKIYNSDTSYTNATNVLLPMNMQTTIGLAFLELQAIPGAELSAAVRDNYRSRARLIANHFKSKLQLGVHDSYHWGSWHWGSGNCNVEDTTDDVPEVVAQGQPVACPLSYREDVSHAAVDIEFAVAAAAIQLGVTAAPGAAPIFTADDLKRFANTLVDVVRDANDPYHPHVYVDGSGAFDSGYSPDVVYWMSLAQYDTRVFAWLSDLLLNASEYQYVNPQTPKFDRDYQGYAAFLKMKYSPSLYPVNSVAQSAARVFVGDFAGSSAKDVLQHIHGVGWRLLISNGDNFDVSFASDAAFGDLQFIGDFTGDGKSDLLQYVAAQGWQVLAGLPASGAAQKHKLATPALWSNAGAGTPDRHVVGDFKYAGSGAHYDDLAYYDGVAWRVLVSSGSAFSTEVWTSAGGGTSGTQLAADLYTANTYGRDLVYHTGTAWRALLSWNYSGTWRFDDYTSTAATLGSQILTADFTNDGRDDVLRYLPSGGSGSGWYMIGSQSYGFPGSSWSFTQSLWSSAGAGVAGSAVIGRFNADALPDLAYYTDVSGESGWRVLLNSGSAFTSASLWATAGQGSAVRAADFTGDGLTDLLQDVEEVGGWRVLKSSGSTFTDEVWHGERGL